MKNYNKKDEMTYWDVMSEGNCVELMQEHLRMRLDLPGICRVLGEDHPIVRLIAKATEIGDIEELTVAQAAYEALPEEVLHRARYPWMGLPPPHGTREKLRQQLAPVLIGEGMPGPDPVGCYLQVDARKGYEGETGWETDGGHVFRSAIVYDLRISDWPVRVQIREGSNKEIVLTLLDKIHARLEKDWDRLTDPDFYFEPPPEPPPF